MGSNREWMYSRFLQNGSLNPDFKEGLESFIQFASSKPTFMDGDNIKCPCKRCDNIPFQTPYTVRTHIGKFGFVRNYNIWRFGQRRTCSIGYIALMVSILIPNLLVLLQRCIPELSC